MKRITETFRVYEFSRVVEETDDEKPSLAPMPAATVYDTTCDEISQVRGPSDHPPRPLAKCGGGERARKAV